MRRAEVFWFSRTLLIAALAGGVCAAQDPAAGTAGDNANPHVWAPRTKSVAVFKNGMGFFMREGAVTLRDGWSVAREIPPAAFGTLAVYSLKKDELVDVVGSGPGEVVEFDGVDAHSDVETKRARLTAALKLTVQLAYEYHGKPRTAAGKLVSVGPEFAVLETNSSDFAVPVAGVSRLQVLELPLRLHIANDAEKPGPAHQNLDITGTARVDCAEAPVREPVGTGGGTVECQGRRDHGRFGTRFRGRIEGVFCERE